MISVVWSGRRPARRILGGAFMRSLLDSWSRSQIEPNSYWQQSTSPALNVGYPLSSLLDRQEQVPSGAQEVLHRLVIKVVEPESV